jgi:heptosyltransferase-2
LRELRKARPEAEITLLIPERGRSLYETCPYVDKLLVIDPVLERRSNPLQSLLAARAYWRTEAKREFDLALSPRVGLAPYLAFILYFSGAPIRLGYSERFTGDLGYSKRFTAESLNLDRLLTRTILDAKPQHEILNSLAVLKALGITPTDPSPELWLRPCDREFATRACRRGDARSARLVIGMCVGAGVPKRVWPLERQAAIAAWLIDTYDAYIVLLGGPNEAQAASAIAARIGPAAISLAGHTSLRQTAAVVQACSILLVNDTGLLHIGSAVGTPTVEISCHPKSGSPTHSNAPERFGPWHVPHRILRPNHPSPPCIDSCCDGRQAHCILEIGTEAVKDALSELIVEQYGWTPSC